MNVHGEDAFARRRLKSVLKAAFGIVALLIIYIAAFRVMGFGVPCLFRTITGLMCPGCGMTHALAALSRGDISSAFHENLLSVTVLPALSAYLAIKAARYIRTGNESFGVVEIVFLLICAFLCIAYFVVRNKLF